MSLTSARVLGAMRIAWGTLFLVRTTRVFAHGWPLPRGPLLGWPNGGLRFVEPAIALGPTMLAIVCVARTVAAIAFTMGVRARIAGIVAGVLGYVTLTQDELAISGSLHLLFLGTIVLSSTACDRRFALRPSRDAGDDGAWTVRALVVSIYAWAFAAKLDRHWLDGTVLATLIDDGMIRPLFAAPLARPPVRIAAALFVAVGELALAIGLTFRRTQRAALVAALVMHACFQAGTRPDSMGLEMIVLLGAFVV